jgi:hypothetical protein
MELNEPMGPNEPTEPNETTEPTVPVLRERPVRYALAHHRLCAVRQRS